MRGEKRLRISQEEARSLLRTLMDTTMDKLSTNAVQALALMWGVADGRRWSWEQIVEELHLSRREAQAVDTEILAALRLFAEGTAHGHFKELVLRAMRKRS